MRIGDHPGSATTFVVLDARIGRPRNSFVAEDPTFQFSDILLARGALLYGEGASIVARDLATGAVRWTKEFPAAASVGGGVAPVQLHATQSADRVLVSEIAATAPHVVALDTRTGAALWDRPDSSVAAGGLAVDAVSERSGGLVGVAAARGARRAGGPGCRVSSPDPSAVRPSALPPVGSRSVRCATPAEAGRASADDDEDVAGADGVAGGGADLLHRAVDLGGDVVLHLHRLEHEQRLAGATA